MGTRKTYIIANWKMNFSVGEASLYLSRLGKRLPAGRNPQIILAPSTVALQALSLQVDRRQFKLAAQNFHPRDFGAFTGETAIAQLKGLVDFAIVGHSERRYIFQENDKDIRAKVAAALRHEIRPILCIGETAEERRNGETSAVIYDQLMGGLGDVSREDIGKAIIAYEPVWAISTQKNAHPAKPGEIEAVVKTIRNQIEKLYGKKTAEEMSVLYGGSVNEDSALAYLKIDGVDGLLIGGASLIADQFCAIVEKTRELQRDER